MTCSKWIRRHRSVATTAYLGAPVAQALNNGAQFLITRRQRVAVRCRSPPAFSRSAGHPATGTRLAAGEEVSPAGHAALGLAGPQGLGGRLHGLGSQVEALGKTSAIRWRSAGGRQ